MRFSDFKKSLSEGAKPIYYLHGDDSYFLRRCKELLKERFVELEELNYISYDFEKPPQDYLSMLCAALNSPPFMSKRRLVIADNFSPSSRDFDKYLKPYFQNPSEGTIFVITPGKGGLDLKSKENVCVVDCDKLDTPSLASFVQSEFAKAGAQISRQAAERLCDIVSRDFYRVKSECHKLIDLSLGQNLKLEPADIENSVSGDSDYKLWEFADFAVKGEFEKAYKVLTELTRQGVAHSALLFRLQALYSNLFEIAVSGLDDAQLSKRLKIKEYAVKMQRRQAAKYTKKQLRRAVELLSQTDAEIKRGELPQESALINALARTVYAL